MNLFRHISASVKLVLLFGVSLFVTSEAMAQCDEINLACNGSINVSINEDCYAAITVDLILENPPFDDFPDGPANYAITITDEFGDPVTSATNTVGEEYIGQRLEVSVELIPCGISCWGYINIEDKIGPKFWDCVNGNLPDEILTCSEYANNTQPDDPTIGGFCSAGDLLEFVDDTTSVSCTGTYAITIVRTWFATDVHGNRNSCEQNIFVEKADLSDIVFPDDYELIIDSDNADNCNLSSNLTPSVTGFPEGIGCPNIMYFFSDIDYPQCGIQAKLLRDWFVIDWCTGESMSRGQIIKVIDQLAPISSCPPDTIFMPVEPATCLAFPVLNPRGTAGFDSTGMIQVLEECSGPVEIEVGFLPAEPGTIQPVDGPYRVIPANSDGLYELPAIAEAGWVRYCFTDACGNSTKVDATPDDPDDADNTCCYFEIFTQDNSPPTAICEGFTKVPLLEGGLTEVPASVFDDHSFDPCGGISHFMVKREQSSCPGFPTESTTFQESVHFCCADLGDTITVRLRVFDTDGNFSECLSLVCVEDQGEASATCMPTTVNLECDEDWKDRSLTGEPNGGVDECNNGVVIGDDEFSFTNFDLACGIGTIRRTVKIYDLEDNLVKTCNQNIIYDEDDNPTLLKPGDYTFPADAMVDICDAGFSLDPSATGEPTTTKTFGCTSIAISYDDSSPFIDNSQGNCYKIQRTWKVVDWCRYDAADPDAYALIDVQEIVVKNSSVPTFNCPVDDLMYEAVNGECEAQVDITVDITSSCNSPHAASWTIDLYGDGTVDDDSLGLSISGIYPVGTHTVTFRSNNECGGGQARCEFKFIVKGDRGVTPICQSSIIQSLGDSGTLDVWASDFDFKSESGCIGTDSLLFSFIGPAEPGFPMSAQTFDCTDVPNGVAAAIPLVVYVIDESGSFSSCFTELVLQDTKDECEDLSNSTVIAGHVFTEFDEPVEDVMIEMENMTMSESDMNMTTQDGAFAFHDVDYYMNYELTSNKDEDYLNGVSTLDIIHIQRHILGQSELASPYKLIAADVDNSGAVSAIDLIELRKLILGIYDELPQNDSWVFLPQDHQFIDPLAPWNYPQGIDLGELYMTNMDADFVAVKVGDVNSSVVVNATANTEVEKRNSNKLYIGINNDGFAKGDLVSVPFRVDKDAAISGMQFTFEFDTQSLLFQGMDRGALDINQSNYALLNNYDGVITFSVNDQTGITLNENDVLFTAYFEAKKPGSLSEIVDINSKVTQAEAYSLSNEVSDIELLVRNTTEDISSTELEVFQNEPNPFSDQTNITFFLPSQQDVSLTVFDANGKVIRTVIQNFSKGVSAFSLDSKDLNTTGILLYRVASESSSVTRKMIMVK